MWGKKMTLITDENRKDLTKRQKKDNSRKNARRLKKNMGIGQMIITFSIWTVIFSKQRQFLL